MLQANPNDGGKWGIMGGAFDPIHNGHLILAESALNGNKLDGVLFVPSYDPPHRSFKPIAAFEDRINMTALAISGNNRYCLSRIEEDIGGPGYTLTLIKHLKNNYSNTDWYLILGADNIAIFDSWYKPAEIIKQVKIIVGGRPGYNEKYNNSVWQSKIEHFDMPQTDVSSTGIRQLLKENRSIEGLLPDSVGQYIHEKGLYK